MIAHVVNTHDIGMIPETTHRLGLPGDTHAGSLVEMLRLDKGEGDVSIKYRIMGKVDLLLPSLTQELLHVIAAVGEGGGGGGW